MRSDPIINWKDVLKGKGLSNADLAVMPVGSSGLTRKELRQTLNGLSGSQAQLVSLLPPAAVSEFQDCIISAPHFYANFPRVAVKDCLVEVYVSYF